MPSTELILSTYNSVRPLWLTLLSVAAQSRRPDGVCVADDGSGPRTREIVDAFAARFSDLPVRHVWHPDDGFQKGAILNRAIGSSEADLLIFTDGDCMLSPCFVERHVERTRRGSYATGSLIRLNQQTTDRVTDDDLLSGRVFDIDWLRAHGNLRSWSQWLKAAPLPRSVGKAFDRLSPIRASLCGANASVWRSDMIAVNGYDETLKSGGQDKEIGSRLRNMGVRGLHLRYSAPVLHLEHPRGYRRPEEVARHRARIEAVRRDGIVWAENGIAKIGVQ